MPDSPWDFFDKKVEDFKTLFASSTELVAHGQFAITQSLIDQMVDDVTRELRAARGAPAALRAALNDYMNRCTNLDSRTWADAALKQIKDAGLEASFPITTRMLTSENRDKAKEWAATQYASVWSSAGMTNIPFGILVTADKIRAMYDKEKDRCSETAKMMGAKAVLAAGTRLTAQNKAIFSGGQIAQARMTSGGSRDIVKFEPTSLATTVGKIASAMSSGYMYVFGVLSGVRQDSGLPFPNPEHYILAFAHWPSDVPCFLFWDPDAANSNWKSRPWGTGFGVIYYNAGRLSTAYDQSDFDKVDPWGNHTEFTERHCYQVYSVSPVP